MVKYKNGKYAIKLLLEFSKHQKKLLSTSFGLFCTKNIIKSKEKLLSQVEVKENSEKKSMNILVKIFEEIELLYTFSKKEKKIAKQINKKLK